MDVAELSVAGDADAIKAAGSIHPQPFVFEIDSRGAAYAAPFIVVDKIQGISVGGILTEFHLHEDIGIPVLKDAVDLAALIADISRDKAIASGLQILKGQSLIPVADGVGIQFSFHEKNLD